MPESDNASAASSRAAWDEVLTELEALLGRAAGGHVTDWVPPGDLGPIPADLEQRARDLVDGQSELIAELTRAQRTTATHLAALRTVPTTSGAGTSVYLDTSG